MALIEDFFVSAVDGYELDARLEDVRKVIANLHTIERDCYQVQETEIDLPGWM